MPEDRLIRVLYIDLGSGRMRVEERADLAHYLGGSGVATVLLEEAVQAGRDPLDPVQPVVLAIGPLTTIFPAVTKTVAAFRSPLTGEFGESHAGGRLAFALRYSGWDALVITGRAEKPVYLFVDGSKVRLESATAVWGLDTEETGRLLRERTYRPGHRSIARIGPAGEAMLPYAGVNVDTYRHFGRLGLGAVWGSKRLKALVVVGDDYQPVPDLPAYNRVYGEVYHRVVETAAMEKYHELGTSANVIPLSALGALPTRNLQAGSFAEALDISGEAFAVHDLMRKIACTGCPIGCIHLALLREEFAPGYEFESTLVSYDHELIYALGSMLGIGLRHDVLRLIKAVERVGLDAISTGVAMAWATEAQERGLLPAEQLGARLQFGQAAGYLDLVVLLVEGRTEAARLLARGATAAAAVYGGSDFAVELAPGQGAAGYHTGYANVVGQLLGMRHSHLDNAGYAVDQGQGDAGDEALVGALLEEEAVRCVLTSLVICLFARKVYDLPTVRAALGCIGIERSEEELGGLGREILARRLRLRARLGFDLSHVHVPGRFTETPSPRGRLEVGRLERMVELYGQRVAASE
jgi:aldehyde:ferredoxin oxidoreductase